MSRLKNLDKFQEVMFADKSEMTHLTPVEIDQVIRYRFAFTMCLENPSIADNKLRDMLMAEYNISQSQAYRDIAAIKIILPNIKSAGKDWMRYMVTEELKSAIQECKDGGPEMMKERILAIDKLAKYNKLDQDDEEQLPWDEILPIDIEPSTDPSVLNIQPIEDREKVIKTLLNKYKGDIEIEDIEYKELDKDGKES